MPFIERTHATAGLDGPGIDDGTSRAEGLGVEDRRGREAQHDPEHDNGRPVVEEALALHKAREALGRPYLLEEGHHGHGVGG